MFGIFKKKKTNYAKIMIISLAIAAVVAALAVLLTKIAQNISSQAIGGAAIILHILQPFAVAAQHLLPFLWGEQLVFAAAVDQLFCSTEIAGGIEQNALGGGAIPTGSAGLLIVGLDAQRHSVVDDVAYIGFVDSHAEGGGGHHNLGTVVKEILLISVSLLFRKSRMIACGGQPFAL